MRRPQRRALARLLATLTINVGFWLYLAIDDVRALGAATAVAVVVTLVEANRLCENLLHLPPPADDMAAVAQSAGVLAPGRVEVDTATREKFGDELLRAMNELEPAFRQLDRRQVIVDHASGRQLRLCNCQTITRGALATPSRGCPVHGRPKGSLT